MFYRVSERVVPSVTARFFVITFRVCALQLRKLVTQSDHDLQVSRSLLSVVSLVVAV